LEEDEIDVVYAERNVLQEEATTVQAETITVDRFRQRFIGKFLTEAGAYPQLPTQHFFLLFLN
jgi:hypothetical protein